LTVSDPTAIFVTTFAAHFDAGKLRRNMPARSEPVLITGAAGFVGFSLACELLARGWPVVGVDNINAYYDPFLNEARLQKLHEFSNYKFHRVDLCARAATGAIFGNTRFRYVVHLAAQAGVRYSLENPNAYVNANLTGFLSVLEGCRASATQHLIFASSSSMYGANTRLPLSVRDNVDHPLSLYTATKKAELMAHAYSHLYGLPATGLRFFTVCGPWGRPDMAMFLFAKAILERRAIKLFNHGRMSRDFTYIDDVVEALARLLDRPPQPNLGTLPHSPDPSLSAAPWRIYSIGNNRSVEVSDVAALLGRELGRRVERELLPMQPGDVPETCAEIDDIVHDVGFRPAVTIEEGCEDSLLGIWNITA
jgi:UDP-glucuronate 4-epimerase